MIKKYWWMGLVLILFIVVGGKIYGGVTEDRFCQKSHTPTTQPPKELKTANDWLVMGDVDFESGNCIKAVEDLDKAIKINPKYAEAYNNRGFIKMRLKKYSEALLDLNKAIELRPNYPHALMNRGDVHKQLDDKTKALADFDRVIKMGKEVIKSEAVCGRREMLVNGENFVQVMWNALLKKDECWKMYFEN